MKTNIYKALSFTAFIFLVFCSVSNAQVTSTRSSNETRPQDVVRAEEAVRVVLDDSRKAFTDGLVAYSANNRNEAGAKFNKSVEVFLYSTLNIQRESRLQNCYNQLIETIYLIEFPSETKLPQVRNLSATCNWNIDNAMADKVMTIARSSVAKPVGSASQNTAAVNGTTPITAPQIGFNTQEFEPSPLDELAKLELTPEEQQVEGNPVAQLQYQYIQYAVANRSLGFSFQVHPMIQQYINYYRGRGKTTMEVGLYRSGMFMLMARKIFKEDGVTENVAWLGQIESAWKPSAMSHMAASGLWQFIPGTGARYGLRRTAYVDERNSFDEATRASASAVSPDTRARTRSAR